MPKVLTTCLIICLLVTIPITAMAKRARDGEAVITLRSAQPCFSYPQDEEIKKGDYLFDYLAVSKAGPQGDTGGWVIQLADYHKKILVEPNSPATCIRYGAIPPSAEEITHAKPLAFNTPYRAFLRVSTASGSEQRYASDFCLIRNPKGDVVLTGVDWEHTQYEPLCLKPGEAPKRSFWQKLFGK